MFNKHFCWIAMLPLVLSVPCLATDKDTKGEKPASDNHAKETKETKETKVQPVSGDTRMRETKVQSSLQSTLDSGKIDADGIAGYQQRLDDLRAQEEELRSRGGMTTAATKDIMQKLDDIENDVANDVKERAAHPPKSD
jgi:hypothetical protein